MEPLRSYTFNLLQLIKRWCMAKVLLVDDEASILSVLSVLLKAEGYEVLPVDNGEKAIELIKSTPFDLMISDIRMPEMRGDEFLSYMKKNELFKSIPIIMLSSEESTTERIRLLEEGAVDYILKPFNPMELKVRIKKII